MRILSVSQVNQYAARLLAADPVLSSLTVEGEISGGKVYSSGHYYFTLKDSKAQISCVFFRGAMAGMSLKPEDGQHVIITGNANIYEAGGRFQMIVKTMEQAGEGLIYAKFVELRDRLQKQGLFAEERKKTLPFLPGRIGVITSPEGAVIRDIVHILRRRHPGFKLRIYPVAVQGPNSIPDIVTALEMANKQADCDVLIICRGGGSLEDLMSFNSEEVAMAVVASEIPVISAVGHETDYTICDFVADLRAPTPSAAAELVLPQKADLYKQLNAYQGKMLTYLTHSLSLARTRLNNLRNRQVMKQPASLIYDKVQKLDLLNIRLRNHFIVQQVNVMNHFDKLRQRYDLAFTNYFQICGAEVTSLQNRLIAGFVQEYKESTTTLDKLSIKLEAFNPQAVIKRGYARISLADKAVTVSSIRQLELDMSVKIHLADGEAGAKVTELLPATAEIPE
ncbi:MAG TPA: exodeoxyribonuclease VII large subunit [Clostridiaceae bacterium]|nr:exodeoxyribonuclease VII large subunit [Clostridiaceae bacterium]